MRGTEGAEQSIGGDSTLASRDGAQTNGRRARFTGSGRT